jgi:hypothetical protein
VIARTAWKDDDDQAIASRLQIWSEREQRLAVERASDASPSAPFDVLQADGRLLIAEAMSPNGTADTTRFVDSRMQQDVGDFVIDTNGCCDAIYLRSYPDRHRLLSAWSERDVSRLRIWRVLPTIEEMRDFAKSTVPECLSPARRSRFGLEPEPPRWCIELGKPPYDTAEWKQWLADTIAGKNPPAPK